MVRGIGIVLPSRTFRTMVSPGFDNRGGQAMTKYLHTMIRVSSLEDTIAFFGVLGLREIRRRDDEKGRYTNVFLAAPGDDAAPVELTYNWDSEPYTGGPTSGISPMRSTTSTTPAMRSSRAG